MPAEKPPAVIVVCGLVTAVPKPARHGGLSGGLSPSIPLTWVVNADRITAAAAALGKNNVDQDFVLQIAPAAFESRQRLRRLLAIGREAVPTLNAIAVRGGRGIEHPQLLVEEGIRTVLVDSLAPKCRGSRRPAPAGWRCHNPAWGLWEVEMAPASRRGPLSMFGLGSRPSVRRGGLTVLSTEAWDSQGMACHRLDRLAAWVGGQSSRGSVEVTTLGRLVARLAGDDQHALAGSVLRAA